ncbi:hypothetical protein Tco_0679658 [Tanacetum coccineum]|uniref:Uncharacterized protein n=1 Tax=Tanacetum coccineum TaxID=301880 RepID=A0ABQ4XIG3_9ASTR
MVNSVQAEDPSHVIDLVPQKKLLFLPYCAGAIYTGFVGKKEDMLLLEEIPKEGKSLAELIDKSQVLLKVPRKNNMYSVDLKNIILKGGLTCLFENAPLMNLNFGILGWYKRKWMMQVSCRVETVSAKRLHPLLPLWNANPPFSQSSKSSPDAGFKPSGDDEKKSDENPRKESESNDQEKDDNIYSTNNKLHFIRLSFSSMEVLYSSYRQYYVLNLPHGLNLVSLWLLAIVCLASNQKFNFSKYIFESMVKNLDGSGKFLMYPRRPGKDLLLKGPHLISNMDGSVLEDNRTYSDKAVNEEMDDSLERAATTATSLDAEQDRGGGPRHQDTMRDTIAQTRTFTGISTHFDTDLDMFGVHDLDGDEVVLNTYGCFSGEKCLLQSKDKVETNYELAQRLQAEEQEELTIEEKTVLVEESSKKVKAEIAQESSSKRAGEELE